VVATTVALLLVVLFVPRSYTISGSYVLTYPPGSTTGTAQQANQSNPFLRYNDNSTVAQALTARVSGGSGMRAMRELGGSDDYTVTTSTELNASPQIIYVQVTAATQKSTFDSMTALEKVITTQLRDMQTEAGATTGALIGVTPAAIPTTVLPVTTSLVRSAVGVAGAGLVLTAVVVALLESRRQKSMAEQLGTDNGAATE
jgi:ribosomal protein L18